MPKKYTGPERRKSDPLAVGRRYSNVDRRWRTRSLGVGGVILNPENQRFQFSHQIGVRSHHSGDYGAGLVEAKTITIEPERRIGGAGRRKTDLTDALRKEKALVFDVSRTPKSAFKIGKGSILKGTLKKIAKKAGPLGIAIGVIGAAKEAKAMGSTIGSSEAYKGEKNILPAKPRIK